MLFNSYVFLFVFLPLVLAVWWLAADRPRLRLAVLTVSSYVFYGYWDWRFCFLMLASTIVDFWCGRMMAIRPLKKRGFLLVSLIANLGLLGAFKYLGFFGRSANAVLEAAGSGAQFPIWELILPVGISFYTFQSLSYSIDIYRGEVEPTKDPWLFAAYVSMFPQLVAGPIVRFVEVEEQLNDLPRRLDPRHKEAAIRLFVIGLAKKLLIADTVARWIDPQLADIHSLDFFAGWWCALGYTVQLYFDFSAYSDMAVGLGFALGLRLPQNFNSPYKSESIAEFWRRWHMSLSTWLRDYLYIPLGGNRRGRRRTLFNLSATMFLGGLWHGANWTFVVWGLLHGFYLVLGTILPRSLVDRTPRLMRVGTTLVAVVLGWVVFRSPSLEEAGSWLWAMVGGHGFEGVFAAGRSVPLVIMLSLIGCVALPNIWEVAPPRRKMASFGLAIVFIVCVLRLGEESPFLYFQF